MAQNDPFGTTALPDIDLLRSDDEAVRIRKVKPSSEPDPETKFLILVVDDSADNVAMLSLDLQQEGYRVVTATDGGKRLALPVPLCRT